jgi:lysyl-tRNA synthetase class 2
MERLALPVARIGGLFAALVLASSATGLLYLLRPIAALGPRIGEALPLDELSKHSDVSFLLFVLVWGLVGAALGLIARAARLERVTAACLLALAVGFWCYLVSGTSVLIVRQVPAHNAFEIAAHFRAVYLPAALAALCGALAGRPRVSRTPRAPLLLAWVVAATGALGILDAVLPARSHTLLTELAPERVAGVAGGLVAPLGFALVVVALGLARRSRRAYQTAVGLLVGLTVLHELHGFDFGALAAASVAVLLVARRHDFDVLGDPDTRPRILIFAVGALIAIGLYGVAAIWINRVAADRPFTIAFALGQTGRALAGLSLAGSPVLGAGVGHWFPVSVFVAGLVAAAWLLHAWLAPWRYRLRQEARERELARELVDAWGVDTLSPFVLRADKSYFFSEDDRAFLAYRVVGGVAVVSGDPIGPPGSFDELVHGFARFAGSRGWRLAILGASERCLDLYRRHGLRALYHGDEAVLETASFSLDGRAIRKVRQSVSRLRTAGYRAEVLHPCQIPAELRDRLEAIAREWRGDEPKRGFVMALDALFRLDDEDAVFVVGRDSEGAPVGFLHFAVCPAAAALSLSSMPRRRTTPNGFNEWLICEAVEWARRHGFERISLNFAPFAALLAPGAELTALQRVERGALLAVKGRFQLDNLLHFNRKFFPVWEKRFVVYERRLDLPRVGLAALAAEAYLPFSGRDR